MANLVKSAGIHFNKLLKIKKNESYLSESGMAVNIDRQRSRMRISDSENHAESRY